MQRLCVLVLCFACALAWAADLPITDVVLFSSGVGYFTRAGSVSDNESVQLAFRPEQINDLLKSLVLLDLDGGKVGAVTYGAKDPISKTLQAFAVNITDNPSRAQLLNRLRGVRAEVTAGGEKISGKILGVETKKVVTPADTAEIDTLSLLTTEGLRSVRLETITALRLLDDKLNNELNEALDVLASGLDNQRKPVSIAFSGAGKRRVLVGYLAETPMWKTAYRLVVGEKDSLLQGWAVVENTGDADWSNVRLSLIAGRPISFIQDLYTPLYVPRPVVKTELVTSLAPVAYNSGEDDQLGVPAPSADGVQVNGVLPNTGMAANMLQIAPAVRLSAGSFHAALDMNDRSYNANTYWGNQKATMEQVRSTVVSAAQAADLGQSFQYLINQPVSLPRQQSALLPIVAGPVTAWKVSIFNADVQSKYPLYGLKVKNTTGLHLMGGPITVYHDNVYAGDATMEDLRPNEMRLLSYAVDLGAEVTREDEESSAEMLAFKVAKGYLYVTTRQRQSVAYQVKNKDGKERTVIVEHPRNEGWKLVEPAQADEKTENLYRFTVRSDGKDAKLRVTEEYTGTEGMHLVSLDADNLAYYLKSQKMSAPIGSVLRRVLEMQKVLRDIRNKRAGCEGQIRSITAEQERIRQNMKVLGRDTALYKRYLAKLNSQETRIESLQAQIDALKNREQAQRKELTAYTETLSLP